jgi:hypothetical protein
MAVRARFPKYSFNAGEISRRMEGRSDLEGVYDKAVAQMLNFIPAVEGPAMKSPGTHYIKEAKATASWLARFVFNTTQAYVFELGEQYVRFFTNGGRIETAPGVPFELAVPYAADEWRKVAVWQSYDRLYLAHPAHPPGMITRTGAETFTYEIIPLINGPYQDFNTDKSKNITWSGSGEVGGIATIDCDEAGVFASDGLVGTSFIFEVHSFSNVKAWEPSVRSDDLVENSTLRRSDGKVYMCTARTGTGTGNRYTGTIEPTHTDGEEWDGSGDVIVGTTDDRAGVKWKYIHDRFGAGTITERVDDNTIKIKVTRRLPIVTQTEETYKWAVGAYSDEAGWPQLIAAWNQRLILWKGVDLAGSVTGSYFDFSPIDDSGIFADDQGFRRRMDVADPPLWVHVDKNYMLAGSASGELVVSPINAAAGLSGDNIRADAQSSYGSAETWPIRVGTGLLFVQRGGRKIRDAAFDFGQDRFVGANANLYARHVTRSGIEWLAYQAEPETLVWGGRGDGSLIVHPHNPEQEVKGFVRRELAAGTALCAVSIPSEDGSKDELWILADLDGQKCILKLADFWDEDAGLDQADACFLDYAVSYSGAPLGTFTSGLSHLEGRAVRVLADGYQLDGLTVTGGAVTLPGGRTASKATIGLGYAARIKLLRPELRGAPTAQGLRKRAIRLFARVIDTLGLSFFDAQRGEERLFDRSLDTVMNTPPTLRNGDSENISIGGGSEMELDCELVSDDAFPCMISMVVPTYDIEELNK